MNTIWGAGIGVAQWEFLAAFGEDRIKKNFWLGRLFTEELGEMKGWVTFRGKQVLIVRGKSNVKYRYCDDYGNFLYYAAGSRYLFPAPSSHIDIFGSHLGGLVITSKVFEGLTLFRWSKLNIQKRPVTSKAYDGITIPT